MVLTTVEPTICIAAYLLGALVTYGIRRTAIDRALTAARQTFTEVGLPHINLRRIRRRFTLGIVVVSVAWPLSWVVRLVSEIVWKLASPTQQDAMRHWFHPKPRRRSRAA